MTDSINHQEHSTRIFREHPFAWYDKEVMRYLRGKYGNDKKTFLIIRAVYTALTEIESDFTDNPIPFFTKTVGSYAGVSREVAGRYLNLLEELGLIKKTRERDSKTNKFLAGTTIRILSLKNIEEKPPHITQSKPQKEPVSGYPSTGVPQRWDTRAGNKEVNSLSESTSNVNENFQKTEPRKRSGMQGLGDILKRFDTGKSGERPRTPTREKPDDTHKRDYLASEIATALGDRKSLGAFRTIAERVPEAIIRDYLAQIKEAWQQGKVKKSRGALFISMIQQYTAAHQIELGFQSSG